MKRNHAFALVALVMLTAMMFASCKSNNKQSAEDATAFEIPEALAGVEGVEKYQTKLDYSQAENWLDVPAAFVKDGSLDASAEASLKPVDVFYIYPTVTGFRDPV